MFFFVACLILTISPLPMANLLTLLARLRLLSFHSFRGTSNDGGRCFSGIWSRQLSTESNSSNSCRIDLSNVIGGSPATPTPSLSNFKSFWSEELACSNDDIFSEIIFDRRRQASARVRLLDCNSANVDDFSTARSLTNRPKLKTQLVPTIFFRLQSTISFPIICQFSSKATFTILTFILAAK